MNDNTNTLENFKIYRDGQLSRWETYRPVAKQNLRSLGNRVWARTCAVVDELDEAWPDFMPQR